LVETLEVVQQSQFRIAWDKFIYDAFEKKPMVNKAVFKRRRKLILKFPLYETVGFDRLPLIDVEIAKMYGGLHARTIKRDVDELTGMGLLIRTPDGYRANSGSLMRTGHFPIQRQTGD
jgi:hypothetical protein